MTNCLVLCRSLVNYQTMGSPWGNSCRHLFWPLARYCMSTTWMFKCAFWTWLQGDGAYGCAVIIACSGLSQGPKKYYVHNDIFHYQDEVFPEEASDDTPEGNAGEQNVYWLKSSGTRFTWMKNFPTKSAWNVMLYLSKYLAVPYLGSHCWSVFKSLEKRSFDAQQHERAK